MVESAIEFNLVGMGALLRSRPLAVPEYQRSYAWNEGHLDDYCTDLRTAFGSEPREYFIGTVVLSHEGPEGRETIIDGQQRLATTMIFLAELRNKLRQMEGETRRAENIHETYIGPYDDEADESVAQLVMNADDELFFRELVVDSKTERPEKFSRESHELIFKAHEVLEKFVGTLCASVVPDKEAKHLVEWRKFLDEGVKAIEVVVPEEADAFSIFETLNDRGATLTLADLLKNYLFGKAGKSRVEGVKQNWINARAEFDNDGDQFVLFIRHYWSSKAGATRERDLYKEIKKEVTTSAQAVKFAKELEENAQRYAALLNKDAEYWADYDDNTKAAVSTLGLLSLEQNRPMLLAALQYFSKTEKKKLMKASVNWLVRGLIVGGIGGGTTEKAYCDAAVKIRNGEIKTTKKLLEELKDIVPTDGVFQTAAETVRISKSSLARYMLNALELAEKGDSEPELVPNSNVEQVNLEHVLPQNAKDEDWPQFDPDERANWSIRLGNLALLRKSHNNRIGNKPFTTKQPILLESDLKLTKGIGEKDDWTPEGVAKRQKDLAALALKAWRRSV